MQLLRAPSAAAGVATLTLVTAVLAPEPPPSAATSKTRTERRLPDSPEVSEGEAKAMDLFLDYLKVNALESFLEVTDTDVAFTVTQACRVSTLPEVFKKKDFLLHKSSEGHWDLDRRLTALYAPMLQHENGRYFLSPNQFSTLELLSFFDFILTPHRGKQSKYGEALSFALTHYCKQEKISNGAYSEIKENVETYIRDDLSLSEALFFLSLPTEEPLTGETAAQFLASGGGALPIEWITKMLANN